MIETILDKGITKYPFLDSSDNIYKELNNNELINIEVPKYQELVQQITNGKVI